MLPLRKTDAAREQSTEARSNRSTTDTRLFQSFQRFQWFQSFRNARTLTLSILVFEAKKRFGLSVLNYVVTCIHIHLFEISSPGAVQGKTVQRNFQFRKFSKRLLWLRNALFRPVMIRIVYEK
jgi:hypothetical protein